MRRRWGIVLLVAVLASCHRADDRQAAILARTLGEIDAQLPQIDASIAKMRANDAQLASLNDGYRKEIADLKEKVAANHGEIAQTYATQLKVTEEALAQSEEMEAKTAKLLGRALEIRAEFLSDKQRRIAAAMEALSESRRKEWQPRVAEVLSRE
jgi:phage shock protein A